MVERKTLNLVVVGSIPIEGAFWFERASCGKIEHHTIKIRPTSSISLRSSDGRAQDS